MAGAKTISEQLFEEFCRVNGVPCVRVERDIHKTPDYVITLRDSPVTCEVKQIDLSSEDERLIAEVSQGRAIGVHLPNRFRETLKHVSAQLKGAARAGQPTLLVVYDNTPYKAYTDHADVVQAMFGRSSVSVTRELSVSAPFFGGDRGLGPTWNTAVSAIAILDGGPLEVSSVRVYHNVYAAVRLDPSAFDSLAVRQMVLPDATHVKL